MSFQATMERLLRDTGASRTTLRLEASGADYPVAAEAVAEGVPTIGHATSVPQRDADTATLIRRERRTLVVDDVRTGEARPPAAMIDLYGLRAFVLAPLRVQGSGELEGWISVHENRGPRAWGEDDLAAVARAVDAVQRELDAEA